MVLLVWAVFLLRCGYLRFLWWWMLEGGMLAMGLGSLMMLWTGVRVVLVGVCVVLVVVCVIMLLGVRRSLVGVVLVWVLGGWFGGVVRGRDVRGLVWMGVVGLVRWLGVGRIVIRIEMWGMWVWLIWRRARGLWLRGLWLRGWLLVVWL